MSVLQSLEHVGVKHFRVRRFVLVLGCLLAQQAFARSDEAPIFFQAASLPSADTFTSPLSASSEDAAAPAFVAFAPMANAARIRDLIASLEDAGDYYSPRIAELAEDLGKALQGAGEHRAALEAYDRGFQIIRRQEGLYSAAQAAILAAEITSHLALGDVETSDALQHSLFSMQQRLLAEQPIALATANLTLADWNLAYYRQMKQTPVPGGRTEAQEEALAERLGEAALQYHQALWLLSTATTTTTNGVSGAGLHEANLYEAKVAVERKIAALMLMVDRQYQRDMPSVLAMASNTSVNQNKISHNPILLNHGSEALQRAIEYSVATAEPVLIAERQLELADWYLLMDQHDEARAAYATAVASLRDAGVPEQQIAAILESGQPVHDPETALLALGNDGAGNNFDGYIDVTFDLNRFGKARNARVLAGAAYDAQAEEDLLRQIRDGRFRPGFDEGAPVDRADVTLRYYFAR